MKNHQERCDKCGWMLHCGCWQNGSISSRDADDPQEYATRSAALRDFEQKRLRWRALGYDVWFAYLVNPEGKKERII